MAATYHAEPSDEKCYLRQTINQIHRGEKDQFRRRIELNDATSNLAGLSRRRIQFNPGIAEHPRTAIKSQVQSGPEPNIDKKAQLFRSPRAFSSTTGRCIFCPRSGTNKHSRGLKVLMDGPSTLQAAFADINIAKDRSVLFLFRRQNSFQRGKGSTTCAQCCFSLPVCC